MIAWLRRLADGPDALTQTEARAALRSVMHDAAPPVECEAAKRAGESWLKPDGREQMDNPRVKPRTYAEWERRHGQRRTA